MTQNQVGVGKFRALAPQPPFLSLRPIPDMRGELQGFSEHGSSGHHRRAEFPAPWDRGSQPAQGYHLVPALRILGEGICAGSQGPEDTTPSAAAIPGPQKQPRIYRFAPIQLLSLLWQMPCACRARASETWRPCPEHQAAMWSEHLPPSTQSWRFCKCSNPTTASWRTKPEAGKRSGTQHCPETHET